MTQVTLYDSFEEMMEDLGRAMTHADARVTDRQKKYRPGDTVVSDSGYGFPILHEVLDIEKIVKDNLWKYGDDYEEDGMDMLDTYMEPHMRNYRFAMNYSEACPDGELGDFHVSVGLYRVPKDAFDELKKKGFVLER